jgi:hypothetical protein
VIGIAAWRCGPGNSDIILHVPLQGVPQSGAGIAFHCWLEHGNPADSTILDFSLDLRRKTAELDAIDGVTTSLTWAPDYLLTSTSKVSTLETVIQTEAGKFFYERVEGLEEMILSMLGPIDPYALLALDLAYQNPEAHIVGPNNF